MKFIGSIDRILSSAFYHYGKLISRHTFLFLLIPLVLSGILCIGIFFIDTEKDAETLFTPYDSIARDDRAVITELFPVNYTSFKGPRLLSYNERNGRVMVLAKDGVNLLSVGSLQEILRLDDEIRRVVVYKDNNSYHYTDLCTKWMEKCTPDDFLSALDYNAINILLTPITYPVMFKGNRSFFIGASLTDINYVNMSNIVQTATIYKAIYHLSSSVELEDLSRQWEYAFLETMHNFESSYIKVLYVTSNTPTDEIASLSGRLMPRFIITFTVLSMFAVSSCMMRDWVLSKPMLGTLGIVTSGLAIISTGGLMGILQVPFNQVVATTPFLAIGIGLDDMFIMLSAWRQTSTKLSVEERMGRTFSDAAVSITITSITDALAFCIGSNNPLRAIKIFCLYSGVIIIFDYIYMVTFFGACMVLIGRREAADKHCYTCQKVLPKAEAPSIRYRIFCAGGGFNNNDTINKQDIEPWLMLFFKNHYGPFLMKPAVKMLVVILFVVYIGVSAWGCMQVREGFERKHIVAYDSYAYEALSIEDDYFTEFGPSVQLVFPTELNYWEQKIQFEIETITQSFEKTRYIHSSQFTTSWFRAYKLFLSQNSIDIDSLNQTMFIVILRDRFLNIPEFSEFALDINFNSDTTDPRITSSRFILSTKDLLASADESMFMSEMRATGDQTSISLIAYGISFIYTEQYVIILPTTLQNLIIAITCMFFVSLVLIPHPICAVWVTFCVGSIEAGVIGCMAFWGVHLNGTSMINIILCIGFSVDFTAHMTYAYVIASEEDPDERAISALHSLGMPIFQGGVSTILGILALSTSPAHIFQSFFKVILLAMLIGLYHGLLVLPVLLSFFGSFMPQMREKQSERKEEPIFKRPDECLDHMLKTEVMEELITTV